MTWQMNGDTFVELDFYLDKLSANPSNIRVLTLTPIIQQPTTQTPLPISTLLNKHNNNHHGMDEKEGKEDREQKKKKNKHPSRTLPTYEETQAVTDSGNVDKRLYLRYVSQT